MIYGKWMKNLTLTVKKLFKRRKLQGTVGIRLSDIYGNRMVKACPIAEWFVN